MRPERPNIDAEGMGFFGRGQQAPSRQLVALEEHCELPAGFGTEPRLPKGFPLFSALSMASLITKILLLVDHKKMKNSYPIQS